MITKIEEFQTSDNQVFDTEEKAIEHENKQNFERFLSSMSTKEASEYLTNLHSRIAVNSLVLKPNDKEKNTFHDTCSPPHYAVFLNPILDILKRKNASQMEIRDRLKIKKKTGVQIVPLNDALQCLRLINKIEFVDSRWQLINNAENEFEKNVLNCVAKHNQEKTTFLTCKLYQTNDFNSVQYNIVSCMLTYLWVVTGQITRDKNHLWSLNTQKAP